MTNIRNTERDRDREGDTGLPLSTLNRESLDLEQKPYSRLTDVQVQRRVDKCIDLRYKADKPILQREWIELCKKEYGDKSVPQYINYWMKAKEEWEEGWRGELQNLLEPAIETLRQGLASDNHYVRSKTIDQIWKMSGNDVQQHKHLVQTIQVGFQSNDE